MKILIIGQAPPAVKQEVPYDTTMLYEWFEELGITKDQALDMFEFEAVYNKFTGHSAAGGHKKPTRDQMLEHWNRTLKHKVKQAKSVICLGACARDFILEMKLGKAVFHTIHPSKRNRGLYNQRKDKVLNTFKRAIKYSENA